MVLTILLVALILALLFYIFQLRTQLSQQLQVIQASQTSQGTANSNAICMDYSNEIMNKMEINAVQNMIENYKDNQLKEINNGMNWLQNPDPYANSDSQSILFKLETLKKFIYHVEMKSRQHGVKNTDHLGLRIYYSAYPDAESESEWKLNGFTDFQDLPYSYKKRHTLVMIPAKFNTNDKDFNDFNPIDNAEYGKLVDGEGDMTYMYQYKKDNTPIPVLVIGKSDQNTEDDPISSAGTQNHGSLFKPGKGSGSSFA